ncbi:MAG: hypothetical protein J5819_01815 [Eubacterium sp.]|nr:hypothetical protein [Eubacterium sp.]
MIDTGIINMFYFYTIKAKATVERNRVQLKGITVDPEILREAVKKAVDRNEYFALTPVLDKNGCVFFEKNTQPVEVYPDDDTYVNLGTAESNGYLFRTLYTEHSIGVSHFHAITDGRGGIAFLVSVLYYYFTMTGHTIDPTGILCDELPMDASEQDILTDQIPEELELNSVSIPGDVFVIPEENTLAKTPFTKRIDICFPARELIEKTRSYSATPVPFVSVLAGKALDRLYDVGEHTIVSSVLVDMHEIQKSRALSNYCCNVFLPLVSEVREDEMQAAIDDQKEWMERINTSENLFTKLASLKQMEPVIRKTPLNDPGYLKEAMKKDAKVGKAKTTYFLTNVGRIRFPEDMMAYIDMEGCEFYSMNTGFIPILSLMTVGDTGHIYVTQNSESTAFAEMVCTLLNENGINASVRDTILIQADRVKPTEFRVV